MASDFDVCHAGQPCRRQQRQAPQFESVSIVQRLEDLMRRCREDGHRLTYQDLLQVRHGDEQRGREVMHVPV